MTTLLILAILSQVRYADEFASSPVVRPSAEFAEPAPFPARALPAALRAAPPAVLPDLPDQVFAPAPLPRRRIIRVVDRPATEPEPTPGIRRPAGDDESLLKRLAEVESRVDALERNRVAAGDRAALKLKSCSPYICNCNAGGECRAPDGCHCGPDHGPGLHHAATATPQAVTPVVKAWRGILGEPGVQGFGPLNEKGEIVVERRRFTPVPVSAPVTIPAPTYATYPQPVVYQEPAPVYGVPTYGAPFGGILGGGCAGGACGVSGRGIFGGLFR